MAALGRHASTGAATQITAATTKINRLTITGKSYNLYASCVKAQNRIANVRYLLGTTTVCDRTLGDSHLKRKVAARATAICAAMNPGTSVGRIPANVSLRHRAIVTAGFANEVDAVNQYAAVMYSPTAKGTIPDREREQPHMTDSSPNVATNSLNS